MSLIVSPCVAHKSSAEECDPITHTDARTHARHTLLMLKGEGCLLTKKKKRKKEKKGRAGGEGGGAVWSVCRRTRWCLAPGHRPVIDVVLVCSDLAAATAVSEETLAGVLK